MRKGFSLLTAIIFLVLVATISAISISLSTQSVKQTGDIFLKTQAELLLRSGTEYAMLAMSGNNYSNSCLNSVNMTYNNMFDINVTIMYIGNGLVTAGCTQIGTDINTSESNRTAIIDIWVRTKKDILPEPIVIHRRTIQKP
ncbi:MAG: type II secretion system protein [Epsilonproteobacteria bacterium]|nr:type II secretion system protein [Campylobacterota bacterium]